MGEYEKARRTEFGERKRQRRHTATDETTALGRQLSTAGDKRVGQFFRNGVTRSGWGNGKPISGVRSSTLGQDFGEIRKNLGPFSGEPDQQTELGRDSTRSLTQSELGKLRVEQY